MNPTIIYIKLLPSGKIEATLTYQGKDYGLHGGTPAAMAAVLCDKLNLKYTEARVEFENVETLIAAQNLEVAASVDVLRAIMGEY